MLDLRHPDMFGRQSRLIDALSTLFFRIFIQLALLKVLMYCQAIVHGASPFNHLIPFAKFVCHTSLGWHLVSIVGFLAMIYFPSFTMVPRVTDISTKIAKKTH